MYLTSLTAIFAAVFAPFLRTFDSDQQIALMIVGLTEMCFFCGGIIIAKLRRNHARKLAGKYSFRTSFYDRRQTSFRRDALVAMRLLVIATIQIVLAIYLYVLLRNGILKHFQEDIFLLASFVVQLAYLSQVAPNLFWSLVWGLDSHDIEIAERGMIRRGVRFIPWSDVSDVRQSQFFDDVIVFVFGNVGEKMQGQTTQNAIVQREQRTEIIKRIRERIST